MQNQQDAAGKPKQSYEIYPTVIFMNAVPWNTWVVLCWHVFIYFLFTFMRLMLEVNMICAENCCKIFTVVFEM